jgi:hypothetical protein
MDTNTELDLERDLLILEATAAGLKDHLLGDALYWTLGARPGTGRLLPKGTLGGLLLRLHRLEALRHLLSAEQDNRYVRVRSDAEHELDRWAVQAEEKALREMRARLHAWGEYLEECEVSTSRCVDEYAMQAEGRTVVELLAEYAGSAAQSEDMQAALAGVDRRLHELCKLGDFVWDPAMMPAFPRERFWWLYVQPRPHPQP